VRYEEAVVKLLSHMWGSGRNVVLGPGCFERQCPWSWPWPWSSNPWP